jgi:hypothetical protein
VHHLQAGETLLVAWQHWFLTYLVTGLGLDGLVPASYPMSCNYSQWSEPPSAMDPTEGDCYDVLWQMVLYRESPDDSWDAESFAQMHMGFGGSEDSPCAAALARGSNPTTWLRAHTLPSPARAEQRLRLSAERLATAREPSARWSTERAPSHTALILMLLSLAVACAYVVSFAARSVDGVVAHCAVHDDDADTGAYQDMDSLKDAAGAAPLGRVQPLVHGSCSVK